MSVPADLTVIRPFQPGDHTAIAKIFSRAVHEIACEVYTRAQCLAWAATEVNDDHWRKRCQRKRPFVAVTGTEISGFLELDPDGHIDCSYTHPLFKRRGIMTGLVRHAVGVCAGAGIEKVYVDASLCIRPLFEKEGFQIVREHLVKIGAEELLNYRMELRAPFAGRQPGSPA